MDHHEVFSDISLRPDVIKMESPGADAPSEVQQHYSRDVPLIQAIKQSPRVVLYSIFLTTAIMMYGYDYSIVGTTSAIPSFQQNFGEQLEDGEWIVPSLWLGLWTFISPALLTIGAFVAGWFQDSFGRRGSVAVGCVVVSIGVAIAYVADVPTSVDNRRAIFLVGKGVQGAAIGLVMTTTQTYVSEISSASLRGPLLALFPTFTLLGQLIGAGVIFGCLDLTRGYRTCFATQWPFAALAFAAALVIPESPVYLVRKNRIADAYRAQERLDGGDSRTEEMITTIKRSIDEEMKGSRATYIDCFNRANLRRTMIVIFTSSLPQLFGFTLLANASYFAQVLGMSYTFSVLLLLIGLICGLIANFASVFVLSMVGRRKLANYSLIVLAFLWLAMGIAGIWPNNISMWYAAATMIMVIVVAGLTVWPASYAISAETSALHLRAKAQGIGWLTSGLTAALFGFVLPYVYNPDQGNLKEKTAFIYAALCAISFVVCYFHVPEMKGRTPFEIDCMFDQKLPAKAFNRWSINQTWL